MPETAADVEDALGAQLDILLHEGQAAILATSPDVTGMAEPNRLGCRGRYQIPRFPPG